MIKPCYNIPMDLPDEKQLWKEREEILKEEVEDTFIPARETKMDKDSALVHIDL